jgi:hypothetical protein
MSQALTFGKFQSCSPMPGLMLLRNVASATCDEYCRIRFQPVSGVDTTILSQDMSPSLIDEFQQYLWRKIEFSKLRLVVWRDRLEEAYPTLRHGVFF